MIWCERIDEMHDLYYTLVQGYEMGTVYYGQHGPAFTQYRGIRKHATSGLGIINFTNQRRFEIVSPIPPRYLWSHPELSRNRHFKDI